MKGRLRRMFADSTARVAVVTTSAGTFALEAEAAPSPGAGEVVVETLATGVCGSDLHLFSGDHPYAVYPLVQGHEVVGRVAEVGAGVDASLVGTLAVVEPTMECGACPECMRGAYNRCENLQVIGVQRPGSLGGRFLSRAAKLHRVPESDDPLPWALVEPVAVACHAVARSAVEEGGVVVVLGAGVIGLSIALAVRERGPGTVIVVEPSEIRRSRVADLRLGLAVAPDAVASEIARVQPAGADVVFEATGSAAVLGGAHELVRPGGQIVVVGQSGADFSLPMIVMTRKELSLIGTRNSARQFPAAIALLGRTPEFAASVITHRLPARDAASAFAELLRPGTPALKVLLTS
jgi:L-iditol 2-dehydrogenase